MRVAVGYSSIDSAGDSANERASSAAKSTRLITCLLFLFIPCQAPYQRVKVLQGFMYRGTGISISWLLSIPCPLAWSHPLCLSSSLKPKRKEISPFFSPENLYLFVLILFASVGPTQQRPYTRSSPIVLRLIPSYRAKSLFRPFLG